MERNRCALACIHLQGARPSNGRKPGNESARCFAGSSAYVGTSVPNDSFPFLPPAKEERQVPPWPIEGVGSVSLPPSHDPPEQGIQSRRATRRIGTPRGGPSKAKRSLPGCPALWPSCEHDSIRTGHDVLVPGFQAARVEDRGSLLVPPSRPVRRIALARARNRVRNCHLLVVRIGSPAERRGDPVAFRGRVPGASPLPSDPSPFSGHSSSGRKGGHGCDGWHPPRFSPFSLGEGKAFVLIRDTSTTRIGYAPVRRVRRASVPRPFRERGWGRVHGTRGGSSSGAVVRGCGHRPHPQRKMAEAQVSPAPNPAIATVSPGRIFPCRTASSSANGMEAADVFP